MNNKKRLVVGFLTGACIFSMTICSVYGAATSRKYVVSVSGAAWKDVNSGGAPIAKVRNGNASRGRYGVNVGYSIKDKNA